MPVQISLVLGYRSVVFKVIDVDHDQRKLAVVPFCAVPFPGQTFCKKSAVIKTGQCIGDGKPFDLGIENCFPVVVDPVNKPEGTADESEIDSHPNMVKVECRTNAGSQGNEPESQFVVYDD